MPSLTMSGGEDNKNYSQVSSHCMTFGLEINWVYSYSLKAHTESVINTEMQQFSTWQVLA